MVVSLLRPRRCCWMRCIRFAQPSPFSPPFLPEFLTGVNHSQMILSLTTGLWQVESSIRRPHSQCSMLRPLPWPRVAPGPRHRPTAAVDVRDSASVCTADIGAIGCQSVAQSSGHCCFRDAGDGRRGGRGRRPRGHRLQPGRSPAGSLVRRSVLPQPCLPSAVPRSATCHVAACCVAAF